jgi:hypothetical protein
VFVDSLLGFSLTLYKSSARDIALKLCGWNFHSTFEEELLALKFAGEVSKAAALAFLYTGSIKQCVEFLASSKGGLILCR